MEIIQGTEYSIIRMPENLSVDAVDGVLEDFCAAAKANKGSSEFLLDMEKIPQLNRAGLVFIQTLHEKITNAGYSLSIAGLAQAVENALRFQQVDDKIPMYKTIIDFERQREIDLVFKTADDVPQPPPDIPVSKQAKKKLNIMVLDPSIASRNNQKLILSKFQLDNLVEASDTQEAVKRLRSVPFHVDVLVADFESIRPIAADFISSIRALPSGNSLRIIVATVDAASIDQKKSSLGIDKAIKKNYCIEDIRQFLTE
jgi:CheY-like chemotaxis protein